ncbi:MAG: hypothetical protein L0Y75_01395 [Acidobacteria bacterium]|nr:hypothetical protein [Acidobacteriota bacterium]
MIAQKELQNLLGLPDQEKLLLAHRLLESVVAKTNGQLTEAEVQPAAVETSEQSDEPSPSAKWLLSMAGMYSGGPSDTGERADEICAAEIKRRSGFTMKEELPFR